MTYQILMSSCNILTAAADPERAAKLWGYFFKYLPALFKAAFKYTIPLALLSFLIGLILGFIVALMRLSKVPVLEKIAEFYSWIIRGTPLIVQLFIIFYGLPSLGVRLDGFTSGVIGLSIAQGAYNSETIRGAILSIQKGQWEAAKALGMSKWQMYQHIVIPQALTVAVPSLANSFIGLTKDTSLCGILTIKEIFHRGQQLVATIYEPMLIYLMCAFVYLIINTVLTFLQKQTEKRFSKHIVVSNK